MNALNINRLESGFKWLAKEFDNSGEIQSIDTLIQRLDAINASVAWAGEQMAISRKLLNEAKERAYLNVMGSMDAQDKKIFPSLIKDYVNSKCSAEEYGFDMAERFCRSLVHIAENLRTAISALKQEMLIQSYAQNIPA